MNDDSDVVKTRAISRTLRFEILRRDSHTCRYCGGKAPDVKLTVDHVIPVALGGGNDPTNLVAACDRCNGGKSATSPDAALVADVDAKAMEWAGALERAADIRRQQLERSRAGVDQAVAAWDTWRDGNNNPVPTDSNRADSMARFLSLGLSQEDIANFIKVAMESKATISAKWRYFCGCCWKEVTARQELAASMLSAGVPTSTAPVSDDDNEDYGRGYADGFDDGVGYGRTTAKATAQADYDEGYADGFRRGADRLSQYDPTRDPSDIDFSDYMEGGD